MNSVGRSRTRVALDHAFAGRSSARRARQTRGRRVERGVGSLTAADALCGVCAGLGSGRQARTAALLCADEMKPGKHCTQDDAPVRGCARAPTACLKSLCGWQVRACCHLLGARGTRETRSGVDRVLADRALDAGPRGLPRRAARRALRAPCAGGLRSVPAGRAIDTLRAALRRGRPECAGGASGASVGDCDRVDTTRVAVGSTQGVRKAAERSSQRR
jgi:hypothetical protein